MSAIPLFELSDQLLDAMTYDDAIATVEALRTCDLAHPPFPSFDLRFEVAPLCRFLGSHFDMQYEEPIRVRRVTIHYEFDHVPQLLRIGACLEVENGAVRNRNMSADDINHALVTMQMQSDIAGGVTMSPTEIKTHNLTENVAFFSHAAYTALLGALATKNVVKRERINKRASRGQGSAVFRHPSGTVYLSRTVVELPPALDDDPEHPPGKARRPHWRRGHLHEYLHGPGRTRRKKIFLPPIFVNADPSYVESKRYRMIESRRPRGLHISGLAPGDAVAS